MLKHVLYNPETAYAENYWLKRFKFECILEKNLFCLKTYLVDFERCQNSVLDSEPGDGVMVLGIVSNVSIFSRRGITNNTLYSTHFHRPIFGGLKESEGT